MGRFEEATGEWAYLLEADTTCTCTYDSSASAFQIACSPEDGDGGYSALPTLVAEFPPNLRQFTSAEVRVTDPAWELPGQTIALAEAEYSTQSIQDPRGAPFTATYVPLFLYQLFLPAQELCDPDDGTPCRTLQESRILQGELWCQDVQATAADTAGS